MLSFLPKTSQQVMDELSVRFKQRRKRLSYTQKQLSERSGVSFGSIKRFETTGQVSLESLLKIALVLECLDDFDGVCKISENQPKSINDVLGWDNKVK